MSNLLCQIVNKLAAICWRILNSGKYKHVLQALERQAASAHAFAASTFPQNITLPGITRRRQLPGDSDKQEAKESNFKYGFLKFFPEQKHPPPL